MVSGTEWVQSKIWRNGTSVNYLVSEYKVVVGGVTTRMVNLTEVSGGQAVFSSNKTTYAVEVIGGRIKLCSPGCSDCDCTACLPGFVMNTASSRCRPCTPGCRTCSESDQSYCLSCIDGTMLNSTSHICIRCDAICETCINQPTNCIKCPVGLYYLASTSVCVLCPNNC